MNSLLRVLLVAAMAALIPACGGSGGSSSLFSGAGVGTLIIRASGGRATGSTAANTANGGNTNVHRIGISSTPVRMSPDPAPQPPSLPIAPSSGTVVSSFSTNQTILLGDALIPGSLLATGAGVRSITCAKGDIVISGSISSGVFGLLPVNVQISAPQGTIFVTGSIRTGSVDGTANGTPGAALSLQAKRVVLTGTLDSSGEPNPSGTGGAGGMITITGEFYGAGSIRTAGGDGGQGSGGAGGSVSIFSPFLADLRGPIHTSGGAAQASTDSPQGGVGGDISIRAVLGLTIAAAFTQNGGRANGTGSGAVGGAGGALLIDATSATGPLTLIGTFLADGGDAIAASGTFGDPILGGAGGSIQCGNGTTLGPSSIEIGLLDAIVRGGDGGSDGGTASGSSTMEVIGFTCEGQLPVSIDASGGTGAVTGGGGGSILLGGTGDESLVVTILATGGQGSVIPGDGGVITIGVATTGGEILLTGTLDASGGSASGALTLASNGAMGGNISIGSPPLSPITALTRVRILAGSHLTANGGTSTGTGTGGEGGVILVGTTTQSISVAGTLRAFGGAALGVGGTGGAGGSVDMGSNREALDPAGDITFEVGAQIDVSGGAGTTGGSARSGGNRAVTFNAGASTVNNRGIVLNLGTIVARGGGPGGHGGDVLFYGLNAGLTAGPAAGTQDLSAGAGGIAGTFTSQ